MPRQIIENGIWSNYSLHKRNTIHIEPLRNNPVKLWQIRGNKNGDLGLINGNSIRWVAVARRIDERAFVRQGRCQDNLFVGQKVETVRGPVRRIAIFPAMF